MFDNGNCSVFSVKLDSSKKISIVLQFFHTKTYQLSCVRKKHFLMSSKGLLQNFTLKSNHVFANYIPFTHLKMISGGAKVINLPRLAS